MKGDACLYLCSTSNEQKGKGKGKGKKDSSDGEATASKAKAEAKAKTKQKQRQKQQLEQRLRMAKMARGNFSCRRYGWCSYSELNPWSSRPGALNTGSAVRSVPAPNSQIMSTHRQTQGSRRRHVVNRAATELHMAETAKDVVRGLWMFSEKLALDLAMEGEQISLGQFIMSALLREWMRIQVKSRCWLSLTVMWLRESHPGLYIRLTLES